METDNSKYYDTFFITAPQHPNGGGADRTLITHRLKELDDILTKQFLGLVRRSTRSTNEFYVDSGKWEVRVLFSSALEVARRYAAILDFGIVTEAETENKV